MACRRGNGFNSNDDAGMAISMNARMVRGVCMAAALCVCGIAAAQGPAAGPARVIVPFPPGGGTDIIGRAIAQKLGEAWAQTVVVENRPGANGTIGTAAAAKAAPDGRTILVVPNGFTVNPSIYANLPFDSERDLVPVTQLATNPMVVAVHPSFPPKSVAQLIAFLRAHPGAVNYASSGIGSPPHLATELFKLMTGTKMNHVPYKGAAPAAVDVIAGHVPMYFMSTLLAVPYLKQGRLRALGVTGEQRAAVLPEVPTIAESGVAGYAMTNWYGMLVPAGTPRAQIERLHADVVRILNLPELRERIASEGATVVASTPEQFARFLASEYAKAARIVKAAGMTANN